MRDPERMPSAPGDGYDVVVVGAGHAGCEAALAAARIGCRTLLVTTNLDLVAQMPCNPSVGGPGKAHLVREVDALGGEMALNTDRTLIQIRMLNVSKGPAVQALRAQVDKRLYSLRMKQALEAAQNLALRQGHVEGLVIEGGRVAGVRLAGAGVCAARAVVLATGTFLNGRVLTGEHAMAAGRAGEPSATGLAQALAACGLDMGRLQTNTPPRVDARTIDYALTTPQYGSDEPLYFSFHGERETPLVWPLHPAYPVDKQTAWRTQLPCFLVHTNPDTHRVVRDNLHRSPVAPGATEVAGPRYCPSLEDKVVRFGQRDAHQLFLEPEGFATSEVYV
ncbi:MAG: tRNA uridine-5-carboxymethylaminomethyl(34) synthesis enzyme MnmG, partial [Chloroflexi bacterium]|nr:tRNA uridine-5-carboxymethylaminomethyl(34) synthesis enzyme MnmG [Chloroflexota bacterium]